MNIFFNATKAETEILQCLKTQKSAKKAVFNKNSLEGCIIKGFIKEENEHVFLTEYGEQQI